MCGIVGIFSHNKVVSDLYDSLIHLQHRGQDSAGISTYGKQLHRVCGKGLVREIFTQENIAQLKGNFGIGHLRYPTAGSNSVAEIQPFWVSNPYGISLSHNGSLINYDALRKEVTQKYDCYLNTNSDSEALLHLFAAGLKKTKKKSNIFPANLSFD